MNKTICDRCGKEVDFYPWQDMFYPYYLITCKQRLEIEQKIDLCRQCMNDFTTWLNKNTHCDCYRIDYGKPCCYGTKEREECTCNGDKRNCDFY